MISSLILVAAGVALLVYERESIYWGVKSRQWPTTLGRLVARTDDPIDVMHSVGVNGLVRMAGSVPVYWYEYSVNDTTYRANRYSFGSVFDTLAPHYTLDEPVAVYYDPANPRDSVLKPGPPVGAFIGLVPIVTAGFILALRLW
jgi:hypothetical protein